MIQYSNLPLEYKTDIQKQMCRSLERRGYKIRMGICEGRNVPLAIKETEIQAIDAAGYNFYNPKAFLFI
jgi:hypothetical protein